MGELWCVLWVFPGKISVHSAKLRYLHSYIYMTSLAPSHQYHDCTTHYPSLSARRTSNDRGSFGPIPGRAEPVQPLQRSSSVGTDSSSDMPTQTYRQPEAEITTQTDPSVGAEMTTQTDRPSQQTTQTERPVQRAASMCTEDWSLVSCTQTEKPEQIAASVATDNQPGTESTTQTDRHTEAEITTQTDRKLEAETTTQTERKSESEGTTQTERKTELTSMTQTEIRDESDTTTQTELKLEAEITTQTEGRPVDMSRRFWLKWNKEWWIPW